MVAPMAAAACSSLVMSQATNSARSAPSWSASALPPVWAMSSNATLAPSWWSLCVVAAPIPLAAPVTTATRSCKPRMVASRLLLVSGLGHDVHVPGAELDRPALADAAARQQAGACDRGGHGDRLPRPVADEPQAPALAGAGARDVCRWGQVPPAGAHSRLLEHELGERPAERGIRQGADVGHLPLAEAVSGRRGEAAEVPMVVGRQRRGALQLQTVGPGGGPRFRRQGEA